jgi:hypothetical protein
MGFLPMAFGRAYNVSKAVAHAYRDTLRIGEWNLASPHIHRG